MKPAWRCRERVPGRDDSSGAFWLYVLERDPGERHDLAAGRPEPAAEIPVKWGRESAAEWNRRAAVRGPAHEETMASSEIRKRVERFASLQAAHRALAHSVHPAELEAVRIQSRRLLIRLQGLSSPAPRIGQSEPAATLEEIDAALDEQTHHTLAVLESIELPQLRATIPLLSAKYPGEVRGLVDVLLGSDLDCDKNIRILEYLITMLSTDDQGERRVVSRRASTVTPRLQEVAEERLASASADCLLAERILADATHKALQDTELGETRDRVRRYKQQLGADLLHPRLLDAAVAYNVAMWNRVANEIESSRSMGELTEGLFLPEADAALPSGAPKKARAALGSRAYLQILDAFRARILDQEPRAGAAGRVVAALDTHAIRLEDFEIFASEEPDEGSSLMRSAIVLGLLVDHRANVEPLLAEVGIDIELLAAESVDDLAAQLSELARKRFADSNYGEAFRLSDVKTHSLAGHLRKRSTSESDVLDARPLGAVPKSGAGIRVAQMLRDLPPWPVIFAGLMLAAVFAVPSIVGQRVPGVDRQQDLQRVSPFLERGEMLGSGQATFFVGRVGRTWEYLNTQDRQRVLSEVGAHFARQGTDRVVLENRQKQIVAEYENGMIRFLVNRSSDDEAGL